MSLVTPVTLARALPPVLSPLGALDRRTDLVPVVPSRRGHAPVVGVSMLSYRLVRSFAVDATDEVVELVNSLELPRRPTRNQWVRLPDGSEHRVLRVVLQAREPATGPHRWAPGLKAVEWTEVELAPEPANQYETAVAGGWKVA